MVSMNKLKTNAPRTILIRCVTGVSSEAFVLLCDIEVVKFYHKMYDYAIEYRISKTLEYSSYALSFNKITQNHTHKLIMCPVQLYTVQIISFAM